MKCRQLQNKTGVSFYSNNNIKKYGFLTLFKRLSMLKSQWTPGISRQLTSTINIRKRRWRQCKAGRRDLTLSLSLSSPLTMSCIGVLPSLSLNHPDYQAGSAASREKKWPELCLKKGTTRGASLCILAEKWLKSQPEKDRKKRRNNGPRTMKWTDNKDLRESDIQAKRT